MRIAICDDEKEICELLYGSVKRQCPEASICCYSSGAKLLIAEYAPDILFLDIQMEQKNGMEVARELRQRGAKTILIFVTALEEYVFSAFDVGAFHYLVKPFSEEKFASVLDRAVSQYQENLEPAPKAGRCFMILSNGAHRKVDLDELVYAEVYNRKVTLHLRNGDLEYYGKLSELEKQAGEDFFRSHRSYLVHMKYVVKYNASMIWLLSGAAHLAKKNYPAFVKAYLKYNQRQVNGGWE